MEKIIKDTSAKLEAKYKQETLLKALSTIIFEYHGHTGGLLDPDFKWSIRLSDID